MVSVSVARVAASVSVISAVTVPPVAAANVLASDTEAVPLLTVMCSQYLDLPCLQNLLRFQLRC